MAPNKFATMLHRRTNKLTRVLVYAFLEWTLIFLLLLNSLFSYFILKFALYFGLKPPCILCSRLDHVLDSQKKNKAKTFSSYTDIICDQHAVELSKIGYCTQHRKLVESKSLCDDCSSPTSSSQQLQHSMQDSALIRWMKEIGIGKADEEADDIKRCSCCDVVIHSRKDSAPYVNYVANLITDKEFDGCFPDQETGELDGCDQSDDKLGYKVLDDDTEEEDEDDDDVVYEAEKVPLLCENNDDNKIKEIVTAQNLCADMLPQHLEFYIDHDDYRLIPIELVGDSVKVESKEEDFKVVEEEEQGKNTWNDNEKEGISEVSRDIDLIFEGDELVAAYEIINKNLPSIHEDEEEEESKSQHLQDNIISQNVPVDSEEQGVEESSAVNLMKEASLEDCMIEKFQSLDDHVEDKMMEEASQILQPAEEEEKREMHIVSVELHERASLSDSGEVTVQVQEDDDQPIGTESQAISDIQSDLAVDEENTESQLRSDDTDREKSQKPTEKILTEVDEHPIPSKNESPTFSDDAVCEFSTSSTQLDSTNEQDGDKQNEAELGNFISMSKDANERSLKVDISMPNISELEEERIPDTPTSIEGLHNLDKKILLLGRRGSTAEESLDGSIISDLDGGDGVASIEKLKTALQSERKTLRALYAELEEERNASAVAANHTMAMITRLQEEKATMQMEALQYQRMMEEQSEYDQEALQMMNELMVKREKEKQELEKELEVYRKRMMEYEEREKMRILSRRREGSMRSRNSSASCSHGEESDGLSIDLNHDTKDHEEDSASPIIREENGHQDTPPGDTVLCLQDSLASFEHERLSILEQLKVLEEKLFTLAEEEEDHVENMHMKPFEQLYEENGKDFDDSYHDHSDANEGENGFSHLNGKHQDSRLNGSMPKRLLPLFDAAELSEMSADETFDGKGDEFNMTFNKSPFAKFELEKKRLAIEEEVDNVYERLQALEADREFLKHCFGSLRKGDKGLDLLQEILQHLRDLKNVEVHATKNMDPSMTV